MDLVGVEAIVNLSGEFGDALQRRLDALDRAYPGRFYTFCNVDWEGVGSAGWADKATAQLRADVAGGAKGLKIYKQLGLTYRDPAGALVMPDDPRIADVWDAAGELGIPVLIHSADPVAFFRPLDRVNERWDELQRHPSWHFYGGDYPAYEELLASLYRLIEAHPGRSSPPRGLLSETWVRIGHARLPNIHRLFRIAELGRVPYSAREWFCAMPTASSLALTPSALLYQTYYRFLEPGRVFPIRPIRRSHQGRWNIYGVFLPDEC